MPKPLVKRDKKLVITLSQQELAKIQKAFRSSPDGCDYLAVWCRLALLEKVDYVLPIKN